MPPPFAQTIQAALKAWPADFSLSYYAARGSPHRPDAISWWVDGSGAGELDVTRALFDMAYPSGRFAGKVDGKHVRAAAEALAQVDFERAVSRVPAGETSVMLQVGAMGQVGHLALASLPEDSKTYSALTSALDEITAALLKQPAAAAELALARQGKRFLVTLKKLGKEPMLIGNPAHAGTEDRFFFAFQVGHPWDEDNDLTQWESHPIPAPGAPFEGGGRYLFLDGAWTFEVDPPPGADKATGLRAIYGDYDRPPGMRLGGVDVFARVIVSEVLS